MSDRKRIYLCLAHMSDSGLEQKYIQEAFDTNWVVPLGPNVNGFEKDLEDFVGEGKRVVALSSGTAAVHLGLLACDVGPGDEVLVQSFTFCASTHPITYLGATPVMIDSEPDTWNMDPDLLEQAIVDRIAKTGHTPKAIVPVALYGMPYKADRILAIADKYGIPVVEDAAEGFGSKYKGRVLGTFGRFGVLSFNGNKMITTSGGGALICPDAELWQKIMWYATQARESYPYYQHEAIGYNYRLSNVCAGIGRGQMTVVDQHLAPRPVPLRGAPLPRPGHPGPFPAGRRRLRLQLLAVHHHHRPVCPDQRPGERLQDHRERRRRWRRRCHPHGRLRHHRLPAQRQRRSPPRPPGPGQHRSPPRLEAHAKAAGLQERPRLRERRLRVHLQNRYVPPCGAVCHRR